MELPSPSGPVSRSMSDLILGARPVEAALPAGPSVLADRDTQLALWMAYELSYRGFDDVDDRREWSPDVVRLRTGLEDLVEDELRRITT